jgi:hypothetical protein
MDNIENSNEENNNESTNNCLYNKSNHILIVSEKEKSVFLPYTEEEILKYLEQYPNQYTSFDDVVKKEFIFPIDDYLNHSALARFRESYALIRDKEAKPVLVSLKYAINLMLRYDLHPAIIAACKSQTQLENYLDCLDRKKLDDFNDFEIKFEVTPLSV